MLTRRRFGRPLVTVVAICFNHERFVRQCLDSIAAQHYRALEIIIIDDHSSDASPQIIEQWTAERRGDVTFIANEDNRGICRNRNEALRRARGEYLASISTDDIWLPEKISLQVRQLSRLPPSVAVLYADAERVDEAGDALPGRFIEQIRPFTRLPEGQIFEELLSGNFIPSLATLVRRDCLLAVGGYDEQLVYEDWDMWLRLARRFDFAASPAVVARYRIVEQSLVRELLGARREEFLESTIRLLAKHAGLGAGTDGRIAAHLGELTRLIGLSDDPAYGAFAESLGSSGTARSPEG